MTTEKRPKGAMNDIWADVCKTFGSDGLFEADGAFIEPAAPEVSGSPALDEAIGIWGYPKGRIVQLAGQESSGKTLMALIAIREWQRKNPINWALFIDAEYTFDPVWASNLGVDLARLRVMKENSGAKVFEFLCGCPPKEIGKAKTKLGFLDQIELHGGAEESGMGIVVLDSIAAIQPPQEITSEAGKQNMALMGRFLPPELRKLSPLLAKTGVLFIAINQVRVDPKKMYGDPQTSTGGSAWKHYCSLMVNFAKITAKDTVLLNEEGELIGHRIRARIDKNKVAAPYRICEFDITYLGGLVNRHKEICELAIKYGIIARPNQTTYTFKGETIARGRDNLYDYVNSKPEFCNELMALIKEAKATGTKSEVEIEIPEPTIENEEQNEC